MARPLTLSYRERMWQPRWVKPCRGLGSCVSAMWFGSWDGLVRVVVGGVAAYAFLVALLRVSGKRTLSKLNAFDLVVTVALGSTLATVLLSKDVPVVEGMHEAAADIVGATIVAAEHVMNGGATRAFNMAGGLHHAHRVQASGFCI